MTTLPRVELGSLGAEQLLVPDRKALSSRLLMCLPHRSYALQMQKDATCSQLQHEALFQTLLNMGADLELISEANQCREMLYTANAGLTRGRFALMSNFRYPARQREEPHFRDWFERNGYRIQMPSIGCRFEGEGDAQFVGDILLSGYSSRGDICSHRWLSETLAIPVLSLQIIDSRFPQLDSCLFPLNEETVVFYPGAFDAYAQLSLHNHFDAITVSEAEALRMACSSVVIGKQVAMPANCPMLAQKLEERGYQVHPIDLSTFVSERKGCKSMVLRLN